jgi:PAS domain S-box-containing protein
VAVVTPRPERRSSIGAWAPLLKAQADLHLCESPSDDAVLVADLVVVDEDCPQLDGWLSRASSEGRAPESIVLFSTGEGTHHGSVAWGMDGEEVLSIISDRLDRRDLLRESDRFLDDLRASNERLDGHRQRFAGLVLEQSEALRGANATLSREVDRLTRLQALARFFTAPGTDDDSFEDRLAEVVAGVLGAAGTAVLVRADDGEWSVAGRWKIARRNALGALPEDPRHPRGDRPSTRKGTTGWWIPEEGDPRAGIVALVRDGRDPAEELGGFEALREMLSDGLRTRAVTRADTSRRAQSERILETLRSGVLKVDAAARVTFANPALAEILRVPVEELENASTERIFPRDAHVLAFLRRVLENGDSIDDLETWITCSLGRRVPVTFRATPVGDPSRPDGALVLVSDLSRRKEVEAEVRRADRLAALGRLSAGVAHEIRNPLTGIRTTAELLRTRVGSADLVRFVDVILEETSRLDRIVGSLLQFAKPPSPQRVPLPLVALLERAGQLAAGRAAEQGVSLVLDAAADLPEPLADRDQMLQVLLNLLINGIEATPAGGRVALAARAVREDGRDEIHLIVEDDGEGVPPAIRERVFDPFFTTKPGGTGLGLSISQNILRQHHGQLRLERHPSGRNRAIAVLPLGPTPPGTGGEPWRTS